MISIDVALDRLLHKPRVLAEFLARGPAALDLAPVDAEALVALDRDALVDVARQIRADLLRWRQRGSGGLLDLFPRTIAAHRAARPDDDGLAALVEAFLDSPASDTHRELPFAGAGCSLEEAFYRFAEQAGLGDAATREEEFLAAIVRALAVSPRPDFLLPAEVRPASAGHFAITARSGPTLFAALAGRFVRGPITPFLAALLTSDEPAERVAGQHGVDTAVLAASVAHLAGLGLMADAPRPA